MYNQSGSGMISPAVKNLLFANIAVFLLQFLAPALNETMVRLFGLIPLLAFNHYFIWQFVTYMFLHGGFIHIFFNMFALWMFGVGLEEIWRTKEFLKYYFSTGIAAGLCTALFSWGSIIPTIGASGAIYGILAAYALFFPDRYVYMYFLFPIKMKYLSLILGALEFFSAYNQAQTGIAHAAHLGGMVVGFFYLNYKYRHSRIGQNFFRDIFRGNKHF